MSPDDLKRAWQAPTSHARLTIDAELLLNEVRRNQRTFAASIFWRDAQEVGVGILVIPVWLYLGITHSLPWTWYLILPGVLWVVGFILVDRLRQKQNQPQPSDSLSRGVELSLTQVQHQIWLLRNVHWWYLLPFVVPLLAFFAQVAWLAPSGGWWKAATATGIAGVSFVGIFWLNQQAVRQHLEPRRQELEALLASLTADEVGGEGRETH